jgi:DNA integrity scanning protein DisA with diadenylate cyclase activity
MSNIFKRISTPERNVSPAVLQSVLKLAVEIARQGREGRKIGTIFTIGDELNVLKYSRSLILDPLQGHADDLKKIDIPDIRETVKELAQLDGAFVISNSGVVISAARYLEAPSEAIVLPMGLGARHLAAAAISKHTNAVAIVVSLSSIILVFDDGEIVGEVLPELLTVGRDSIFISHPHFEENQKELITVVTKKHKNKEIIGLRTKKIY